MAICGNIQQGDKSHFFFENIQTIENSLADQPDDKLRRIALSALFQQARYGSYTEQWTPALLQCLQIYQNDSSPLVAEAALVAQPKAL